MTGPRPHALAVLAMLVAAACGSGNGEDHDRTPAVRTSIVAQENQKAGSDAWQFWLHGYTPSDDVDEQVKGYASATSVDQGDTITFHVSTNPPQPYTITVYRLGWYGGAGATVAATIGPLAGERQPECPIDAATGLIVCAWRPSHELEVPTTWVSGIYVAVLQNAARFASMIVFVVRDDARPSDLLYQQSVTTYQAYNDYPSDGRRGKSLYGGSYGPPTIAGNPRAVAVSFDRPYAKDGAGDLLKWEIDFVRWLERSGYDVRYSTDVDTHLDGEQLLRSRAFLSVGHDEYWSQAMFDAVERARDAGIHLGFFGANIAYWQVRFEPAFDGRAARTMICYKDALLDPVQDATTTVQWRDPLVGRPEQRLIGVQYGDIIAGGITAAYAAYVVQNAHHWAYTGTGLRDGDTIPGVVGYETDRYHEDVPLPDQRDGSWTLLSTSPYTGFTGRPTYANSAVYQAPSGAWVFAAGSIGWSLALDAFGAGAPDERLQRVTRNVLDQFVQ